MNAVHVLAFQFCGELAATSIALLLALACPWAEASAKRGEVVAATPRLGPS